MTLSTDRQYVKCSSVTGDEKRYGFNGKEGDDEAKGKGNSLDFGARIYDPRTGRWLSRDRESDKASGWSPYRFGFDSPIKFSDIDGNFEVDPDLAKRYPKVALLILNAHLLYNNLPLPDDLQKALEGVDVQAVFNDTFRAAFETWSTLPESQLQEILKPGSGPLISSENLDFGPELKNGENKTELDQNFNPLDKNVIRENGKSGELVIDNDVVEVLEFELLGDPSEIGGLAGKVPSVRDKVRAFKSFVSTVFHEAVHYGRNATGVGNTLGKNGTTEESGKAFEIEGLGGDVSRTTKESLDEF